MKEYEDIIKGVEIEEEEVEKYKGEIERGDGEVREVMREMEEVRKERCGKRGWWMLWKN
ncbi:hypothetical protein [Priestia megaterium]|uniref:hypothetical protein n=1 Tax=Priestia megaterium TaxID=1404 RepID=UPI00164982ED|nr:hypothetical protein [Priestia megaterium]